MKLIAESALDLFIGKGYGETKIADIAKVADMSIGLLFHYFDSEEKLYEELIYIGAMKLEMEFAFSDDAPLTFFRAADKRLQKSIPLIEKGQLLGEIKAGNPEALSVAFWNSLQGIAQFIALNQEVPCPEADWIVSILEKKENA